ncbi:uncharacterized protein TNCV_3653001 [Trichonephila clavipes]|nr:uncharacterized protein TNCV_3653001 [Trichonephila clavipes]
MHWSPGNTEDSLCRYQLVQLWYFNFSLITLSEAKRELLVTCLVILPTIVWHLSRHFFKVPLRANGSNVSLWRGVVVKGMVCYLRSLPCQLTEFENHEAAVAEWYRHRIVAGFVTSSSPVPLKTCRVGQRCTLNLSRAETSSRWCGVVVRRGGASSGVVHVT